MKIQIKNKKIKIRKFRENIFVHGIIESSILVGHHNVRCCNRHQLKGSSILKHLQNDANLKQKDSDTDIHERDSKK